MPKSLRKNKIKIRKANFKDTLFLFKIQNENIKKGNFYSKKEIKYPNHKKWIRKNIPNGMIFICYVKYRIGYIRYEKLKKNNFLVSIAIKQKYKKKGYGKFLLKNTLKKINLKKFNIYASVKTKNLASRRFFENCNFKLKKKNTYVLCVK